MTAGRRPRIATPPEPVPTQAPAASHPAAATRGTAAASSAEQRSGMSTMTSEGDVRHTPASSGYQAHVLGRRPSSTVSFTPRPSLPPPATGDLCVIRCGCRRPRLRYRDRSGRHRRAAPTAAPRRWRGSPDRTRSRASRHGFGHRRRATVTTIIGSAGLAQCRTDPVGWASGLSFGHDGGA